jgi:hypothetical protein
LLGQRHGVGWSTAVGLQHGQVVEDLAAQRARRCIVMVIDDGERIAITPFGAAGVALAAVEYRDRLGQFCIGHGVRFSQCQRGIQLRARLRQPHQIGVGIAECMADAGLGFGLARESSRDAGTGGVERFQQRRFAPAHGRADDTDDFPQELAGAGRTRGFGTCDTGLLRGDCEPERERQHRGTCCRHRHAISAHEQTRAVKPLAAAHDRPAPGACGRPRSRKSAGDRWVRTAHCRTNADTPRAPALWA